MMNLYSQKAGNIRKTWALIAVFAILVIAIGYGAAQYFGNQSILYFAVIFAVVTNFYSYWFSDKLVLSLNGARVATREEFFDFYTITENLCISAGMQMPKLYVMDDPAPNAFATGRNEKHAVVCATTGLLQMMNRSELEGVIAHELSHIRNNDILLMTVAVVLAGFVALIANMFVHMSMFGGDREGEGRNGWAIVLGIIGIMLAPIAAQLIQMAISRRREFLADASSALLTRYPEGLASALEKISGYSAPMQGVNVATAHLFISNPFGDQGSSFSARIEKLFSTHPPVEERLRALRNL